MSLSMGPGSRHPLGLDFRSRSSSRRSSVKRRRACTYAPTGPALRGRPGVFGDLRGRSFRGVSTTFLGRGNLGWELLNREPFLTKKSS